MPRCSEIVLAVVCSLYMLAPAKAQYRFDNAIRITQDNILPSNDVRSIKPGTDGFVWIATGSGLCRFDGQMSKTYRNIPGDSTSLFPGTVNIALPWRNEIWVATNKGISALDLKTDKFRHYQISANKNAGPLNDDFDGGAVVLYIDSQNDLWAGTRSQGVWLFDTTLNDFRFFSYPESAYIPILPALATNYSILSIASSYDNPDIVWVGTPSGLEEINKKTGEVKWYTFPQRDKDYQVSLNAFRRLYHHSDGLLYVGSWSAGVNVFDPKTKSLTPLEVKSGTGADILTTPISHIMHKSDHEIWITTLAGLVVYDTRKKAISLHKYNNGPKNEFYGVEYVDSLHRVWLNTINGIHYFDPIMQQFATYAYDELYGANWGFAFYITPEESENKIAVLPRECNGLYLFDRQTNSFSRHTFPELKAWNLKQLTVRGFAKLTSGDYFISADEGLFIYKKAQKRLTRYLKPPKTQFSQWGDIFLTNKGHLWIAANADGLVRRDLNTGEDKVFRKELRNLNSTHALRPFSLFADSNDNLWFACENGFGVYASALDTLVVFLYRQDQDKSFPYVNWFAEDRQGRVWVNTNDVWIGYADVNAPEKGLVRKISLKERGVDSRSYRLATDSLGYVWGYTDHHLFKIDDPDKPFRVFSFNYGIKSPDFFHFSFLRSGEMIFGGRNSITLANPCELRRNREIPVPYIMQVRILNRPVESSMFSSGHLNLNHKQNFLSISFSARAFTMAEDVKFRYRLKGFDNWTEATGDRLANYTNIPPGNYVFQLRAANNEGLWNEKMLELPVTIETPWWLTLWFRIGAVLALAFLAWWLYRYRVDQIRKKEQLRSQYEKKLANVEMSALLAQMNPHFLFNSLNSIDSYIIRNESHKASEYLNNFARLMRLILQNSRSNYISLKDELETLDLYLQMESLRFANRFDYEIKVSPGVDSAAILIPPMLIQPYVENAIWHGLMHKNEGGQGKVELMISKNENNLFCVIQDNGIGREKAETIRTQHPGNRKRSMGMQITKDRMEMINKLYRTNTSMQIIDLHDERGNATGTRVELVIPI